MGESQFTKILLMTVLYAYIHVIKILSTHEKNKHSRLMNKIHTNRCSNKNKNTLSCAIQKMKICAHPCVLIKSMRACNTHCSWEKNTYISVSLHEHINAKVILTQDTEMLQEQHQNNTPSVLY